MHRQDQDRRIGRIDLLVGRRHGQVLRQVCAGRLDRRLHVLRGAVDVAVEIELQRDRGRAERRSPRSSGVTPAIWPNWRSSGVATVDAMVSGLAPGNCAVTWMVGKSTCGSGATGSSG